MFELNVGSVALIHHIKSVHGNSGMTDFAQYRQSFGYNSVPRDYDIILRPESIKNKFETLKGLYTSFTPISATKYKVEFTESAIWEIEIAEDGNSAEKLLDILESRTIGNNFIAPIEVLYALKMSHRFLKDSKYFWKTVADIRFMREYFGVTEIPDYLREWYAQREKETYTYPHPKLNVNKSEFFSGDGVIYHYDHDSIHDVVKIYDKPAYNYFKPDENEVFCSKAMFDTLPYEIKLASVMEEASVLALERSIIPFGTSAEWAYDKALQKVCTSITSGWWRDFAWENCKEALDTMKERGYDFNTKFNNAVNSGAIKRLI